MRFEWDRRKARSNRIKHGVTFEVARLAFDDPAAFVAPDVKHSTASERRHRLIGESGSGLLVVVFTERGRSQVRLISARRAGRRDRRKYAAFKRDAVPMVPGPEGDA